MPCSNPNQVGLRPSRPSTVSQSKSWIRVLVMVSARFPLLFPPSVLTPFGGCLKQPGSITRCRHTQPRSPGGGTAHPSQPAHIDASPPPSLSPQTKYPMQRGTLSHTSRPVAQGARRAAPTTSTPTRWPVSQQTPGLLTRRPPFHHPFWPAQHAFHAHQGEQPTGGQSSCGPAAWPGTGAPYSGARSPSTAPPSPPVIPKAAAHHWERQHRSQPRAHPSGVSRAAPPPLPLHTTTRVSHARRSAAHRRAIQARRQHGRGPARHIRRASLIIESGHIAATHGGKEASCLAAPRLTHHSGHRDHPRAVRHPPITTWATQAADAFAKTLPSSTSPRPLAYARSEGECCK
jgi:hypothetical protein